MASKRLIICKQSLKLPLRPERNTSSANLYDENYVKALRY